MSRRDQHIMLGLAAVLIVFAMVQSLAGLSPDVLLAAPALLLFLPLWAGRYVGEDGLVRLATRGRAPARRVASSVRPALRAPRVLLARGGRLIAVALAERAPPAPLPAR